MRKYFLLAGIAFCTVASAQNLEGKSSVEQPMMKEGTVLYERTRTMQFTISGGPDIPNNLPKTRTDRFELLFSANQSLWQALPNVSDEANQMNSSEGGVHRVMVAVSTGGTEDVVYHNFEKGKRVDQRELRSKNFTIEDNIQKNLWKLTDETKTILGHKVRKAVAQSIAPRTMTTMENGQVTRKEVMDTSNIVAWFATDIPVPAGPASYQGQLPGLVLEIDINNGRNVIKAVEISPKVNVANIKEPKGGKRITVDEYNKEREKAMEEMRQRFSQDGGRKTFTIQSPQ